MKFLLVSPSEYTSDRFWRLCEYLKMDEKRDDRLKVWAHLNVWFGKWASDPEYDHGLFWNVSEKRLGAWADWEENPTVFGRALRHAGYVSPAENVYPAELCNGRPGFVAMGPYGGAMLDESWIGWHRGCALKAVLPVYITDRAKRATAVSSIPGAAAEAAKAPPGWVDPPPAVRGDNVPGTHSERGAPALPPAPPRRQDVDEKTKQRQTSNGRTGNPKTPEMLAFIREHKYDNPLECCRMTDGTNDACKLWVEAVELDQQFVSNLLANMTETDNVWSRVGWPSSILTKQLLGHVQKLRRQGRRRTNWTAETVGGAGGRAA